MGMGILTFQKRKVMPIALIVVGLIGISISSSQLVKRPNPPQVTVTSGKSVTVTPPSSKRPSLESLSSYTVPATDPKYISIPAIKLNKSRIVKLGINSDNSIAVPSNLYDAGWYSGSSHPGEQGAMFIYGHVSSWSANGMFYNLHRLHAGDVIHIVRGDNASLYYKVVATKTYLASSVDMNEVLSPIKKGAPGLNLMTCSGRVIKGTNDFSERLVVFSAPVSN